MAFTLSFGDGTEFKSGPMAVVSIDRREIVHTYALPDGVDVMDFEANLSVYDDRRNMGMDEVLIGVGRGQP